MSRTFHHDRDIVARAVFSEQNKIEEATSRMLQSAKRRYLREVRAIQCDRLRWLDAAGKGEN